MTEERAYTVRPLQKPVRADLKDVFRVYLSPTMLGFHKLRPGDVCRLESLDGIVMAAIAWAATERIQDTIIQTSKVFQTLHGLKLGDKVTIHKDNSLIEDVKTITLSEVSQDGNEQDLVGLDKAEQEHWRWFLEYPLDKAEILCPGLTVEGVELKGSQRSFKIEQINSSSSSDALYRFVVGADIQVKEYQKRDGANRDGPLRSLLITKDGIGGLTRQLAQLNQRLSAYSDELQRLKLPSYYRARRGGILLYGPAGTGKSLVLRKIAEANWRKVLHIDTTTVNRHGNDRDISVNKIFNEARRFQPSVVIIDRLESMAGKLSPNDENRATNISSALCEEFSRLGNSKILVIGATTTLTEVDESVRRPGCFELQIEIPIPDSRARTEILKILSDVARDADAPDLETLGEKTHGFAGADLDKLVQLAVDKAKTRTLDVKTTTTLNGENINHAAGSEISIEVTEPDLNAALLEIRPTAMQEVFLETPKVRWTDIGGQHEIKKSLKQAVEWPFKYPEEMSRLGIDPKKGLLLYGPPGCSKTLTAKAVATESRLNFLAVKGAELLSMYVGESERAVREVFRKARAAAPSILFFDEIDAIGSRRSDKNGNGGSGELNVLTTLLNELDGIEVLKGVFVLAATNKPEVLDEALMRPGRLDTLLYVGPPDREARLEILAIRLGRMDVAGDVEVNLLAERTEGYSGAELVSVCQKAGYAALEEQERERTGGVNGVDDCEAGGKEKVQVGMRHFEIGLGEVQRMITAEMRARFENWGRRVRS
ncbi:MAG: AAA+-type ATPase [Icmadophila ericetorum]|nr:AAA+-type ATPase [Icmadophila ericetorum]